MRCSARTLARLRGQWPIWRRRTSLAGLRGGLRGRGEIGIEGRAERQVDCCWRRRSRRRGWSRRRRRIEFAAPVDRVDIDAERIPAERIGIAGRLDQERKSVVEGKSVSVRVDPGGRRLIKQKKDIKHS